MTLVGAWKPEMMLINVVLPEPFLHLRVKTNPLSKQKSTPVQHLGIAERFDLIDLLPISTLYE